MRLLTPLILIGMSVFATAQAQVALTNSGYTQNFDQPGSWQGITTAGFKAWNDNSTLAGWYASNVNGTAGYYRATNGNGANPAGGTGNPGTVSILALRSTADGSLGSVSTSSAHGVFGVRFVNQTGAAITSLTVSYTGEQWAWNNGGANTLSFAYSQDATSLSNGEWTNYSALSFTALHSGGTNRALDGNSDMVFDGTSAYLAKAEGQAGGPGASNHQTISATITGLSIGVGEEIWFRWTDVWVGSGSQIGQALSIDNLNVTIGAIPEPASAAVVAGFAGLALLFVRRRHR